MKLLRKATDQYSAILEAETADELEFIGQLHMYPSALFVERFGSEPADEAVPRTITRVFLTLDPKGERSLTAESGRKALRALRELGGLIRGELAK